MILISCYNDHMHEGSRSLERGNKDALVAHNLQMMAGEMQELLLKESMGGNAGHAQTESGGIYICATAKGYMDSTGKIIGWGNIGDVPDSLVQAGQGFKLDVSFNRDLTIHKIVEAHATGDLSEEQLGMLNDCIERYNKNLK